MIILPTEFTEMPWKNGGGTTLEIFRGHGLVRSDDWTWRLSMARLDADGPFSHFEGITRILTFLGPGEMILTVEGDRSRLTELDFLEFPGDATVSAEVTAPPAWDLNLMGRRDSVRIAVQSLSGAVEIPGDTEVFGVFAARGSVLLGDARVPMGAVGLQTEGGRVEATDGPAVLFTVTHLT